MILVKKKRARVRVAAPALAPVVTVHAERWEKTLNSWSTEHKEPLK